MHSHSHSLSSGSRRAEDGTLSTCTTLLLLLQPRTVMDVCFIEGQGGGVGGRGEFGGVPDQ